MSLGSAWDAAGGEAARKESEIQAFVGLLRRRKYVVALVIIVATIGAAALVKMAAPVYQGRALIRAESSPARAGTAADQRDASIGLAATQAKIITDPGFLTEAAAKLGTTYDDLAAHVSAAVIPTTELIRVTTTGPSAAAAQSLAQRFAAYAVERTTSAYKQAVDDQVKALTAQRDVLQAGRSKRQAQRRTAAAGGDVAQVASLDAEIADLGGQIAQLDVQISETIASGPLQNASVSLVSRATASDVQISPRPVRSLALGVLLGIVIGVAIAWLRDQFDRRVRTLAEVEAISGGMILGTVPIIRSADPRSLSALENAFDFVRVNVSLATREGGGAFVLAITSSAEGEGKTFVTLEFARALARAGRSVAVVDADLRRRALSLRTETDREAGLGDLLRGHVDVESAVHEYDGIGIVPAGPAVNNPSPLLDSRMFEDAIEAFRRKFDFVIIDTPPAAHIADASIVARRTDATVIVTRLGVAERSALRATIALFRQEPFNLLGVIVQSDAETLRSDYHYLPPRTKIRKRDTSQRQRATKTNIVEPRRGDA
jgi:succinoglycan biosynthesis transport protein ExoP